MELSLHKKRAIVTGAASGIGRATSLALATEGVDVIGLDIDEPGLTALRSEANDLSGSVRTEVANFADADETVTGIRQATEVLGGLDVLVNNVGSGAVRTFDELSDEDWQSTIDLNFMSYVRSIRTALPVLRTSQNPVIINNASDLARQPEAVPADYSAAKAAVLALTKSVARAEGPKVRVNAVAPGPVWSNFWTKTGGFADTFATHYGMEPHAAVEYEMKQRQLPLARLGTPDEVANVIVFLCSEASSFVTGAVWGVDGGSVRGLI